MRDVPTGVIDIGTNTLLLLIVDEQMTPLIDACRFGRLGKGLDASGLIDAGAIQASLAICREYRALLDAHGVPTPVVIGTQALREAANRADFVTPAEAILGAPIEVIAGAREAELAFLAVQRTFPALAGSPYVVVDVGGGSTEVIATDGMRMTSAVSLPIGAVRLHERYLAHDPPTPAEVRALVTEIDRVIPAGLPRGVPVVGTAGTATTMAAIARGLPAHDPAAVTGVRLTPMAIDHQLARLLTAPISKRRGMHGLEPQRADVIAAGVAILSRIVHRIEAPALITCDRGIRWGLAFESAR